jgi:hypothetical protein
MFTPFHLFLALIVAETEDKPEPPTNEVGEKKESTEQPTTESEKPEETPAPEPETEPPPTNPEPEAEQPAAVKPIEETEETEVVEPSTEPELIVAEPKPAAEPDTVEAATPAEALESATPEDVPEAFELLIEPVEEVETPAIATEETAGVDESLELVPEPAEDRPVEPEATAEAETDTETQPEVIEMPLGLGVIDELYNFVATFGQAQISNAESTSASTQDYAGGVSKPALFEHPRAEGEARIEYTLALPQLKSSERLILHFSIGLRDGVDFDTPQTKPDGVQFAVEVSGERRFEAVSEVCRWEEHAVDVSDFAGKRIQVGFLTNCNGAGNTNFDWGLWGNPRLLKLARVSLPTKNGEEEPQMMCGVAVATLADIPNPATIEFAYDEFTSVFQITDEISQRLIADAELEGPSRIVELALYTEQPKPEIGAVGATTAIVPAGEDFELQCTIRNDGAVPLTPFNNASISLNRIKLRRGRHTHSLKTLNPGEESTVAWRIRSFSRQTTVQLSVSLRYQTLQGEVRQRVDKAVEVRPSMPKLPAQIVPELCTYNHLEHVITENQNLRVVFVRGVDGFEYYALFVASSSRSGPVRENRRSDPRSRNATRQEAPAKNGSYRQVAVCNSISEVRYRDTNGRLQQMRLMPTIYRLAGNNRGESIVILSADQADVDGVRWSYEARFILSEGAKRLKTEYRLVTDGKRELVAFNGPILRVGDEAFEADKSFGLFPGLEFLEGDEASSSPRDAAPPINNRLVPHPYKITIPLMAVEHSKVLVGLVWNPLETWDGEHNMLSAIFASPNWHDKQQNHLMGLFLPTPDWVEENRLEASTPYALEADRPITIRSQIIVDANASILDALTHWTDAYGTVEPLALPRNDEDELLLSRHALMHTVWDEETGKSQHCVGWAPANAPGFATLLWYDYLATQDEAVKRRVSTIAENTLRESGPGGLVSPALCHILMWEFPFYYGHIEATLDRLKETTRGLIDAQEEDGSWRFHPTTDRAQTLGNEGDATLGTCAKNALVLFKHARITSDEESLEAGLKALAFMERFNIPRGAQAWECPLYEPDILAAAHAVGAYVEAYEITSNSRYLQRAEYWATTGLPFLYHWNLPDRPGMRFASIPVFGTTFYTHSWFGVPVQWNGLVFAYYLQHLARHSRKAAWEKIAEGITISAMYQQWTEGELKGTYPDGFYGFCTEGRGPHINPEDIMVNLYTLRGLDPDISTRILSVSKSPVEARGIPARTRRQNRNPEGTRGNRSQRIHLSTGAQIESFAHDRSGALTFRLRYVQHETSHCIITGYGVPDAVHTKDGEIPAVENIESAESGWLYRAEKDIIFLKYKHPSGEMDFKVIPYQEPEPKAEPPPPETSDAEETGGEEPETSNVEPENSPT